MKKNKIKTLTGFPVSVFVVRKQKSLQVKSCKLFVIGAPEAGEKAKQSSELFCLGGVSSKEHELMAKCDLQQKFITEKQKSLQVKSCKLFVIGAPEET